MQGPGRNTKIASAPVFSGFRRGDEVPESVMRISGRGEPKRPLPMCGTPRTSFSRTSVRVDLDVECDGSRPGVVRERREGGFEQGSWYAGTRPTGLGGRGLGAGEESGVPDPAGGDPFCDPGAELVGVGWVVLVVCGFHCVVFGFGLR